jgi:hypothetical protein
MKIPIDARIEWWYGKNIVCGHIFPGTEIEVGTKWQNSGGGQVEVIDVKKFVWKYKGNEQISYDVYYKWIEDGVEKFHDKDSFSFQCRYCLIVEDLL